MIPLLYFQKAKSYKKFIINYLKTTSTTLVILIFVSLLMNHFTYAIHNIDNSNLKHLITISVIKQNYTQLRLNQSMLFSNDTSKNLTSNSNTISKNNSNESKCVQNCGKSFFIVIIFCLITTLIILIYILKRNFKKQNFDNPILKDITKTTHQIISNNKIEDSISLEELIIKAKKTDPLFSTYFEKCYPVFYKRLNELLKDVTVSDLKFCLFLKLKLSSKEIADNMHVSLKAIYNRNNRFRKRINIKEGEDLYTWAEKFDKE